MLLPDLLNSFLRGCNQYQNSTYLVSARANKYAIASHPVRNPRQSFEVQNEILFSRIRRSRAPSGSYHRLVVPVQRALLQFAYAITAWQHPGNP